MGPNEIGPIELFIWGCVVCLFCLVISIILENIKNERRMDALIKRMEDEQ